MSVRESWFVRTSAIVARRSRLLALLALSCSIRASDPIGSSSEAIASSCSSEALTLTFSYPGNHTTNPTTGRFIIPSQITFGSADVMYPITGGATLTATLAFGSTTTCTWTTTIPNGTGVSVPPTPWQFQGCTNSYKAGQEVTVGTSITLTASSFPSQEDATFHITALVGKDLDDGDPCDINVCNNGVISTTAKPYGTPVYSGDPCYVGQYCTGTVGAAPTGGTNLDGTTSTSGCITYTCEQNVGYVATSNTCQNPSGVGSYPGNGTVVSNFAAGTTGLQASQSGLTANLISATRAAIIRGRVTDTTGNCSGGPCALSGVTVSVVARPEYSATSYGQTTTRSDGYYDIVVNGGASYILQYTLSGHVIAQRTVAAKWLDFTGVHDVALVAKDVTNSIEPNLGSWQHARGSTLTDADGSRTATVLIPPNTTVLEANKVTTLPTNGGGTYTFRATESTASTSTLRSPFFSMPADLPPQSGYTYAANLSIDEAESQNISPVWFSNSTYNSDVLFYVENITEAPVGGNVPAGNYHQAPPASDAFGGQWEREPNGIVVQVLGYDTINSAVKLSVDGSTEMNYSAVTPNITLGERQQLYALSFWGSQPPPTTSGKNQLWRVGVPHFSDLDCNWAAGPPPGAIPPPAQPPVPDTPKDDPACKSRPDDLTNMSTTGGSSGSTPYVSSTIECENQVLGEDIPIAGTPLSLHYRSEMQNGYHPTIAIPVTDGRSLTGTNIKRIEAEIQVAGHDVILEGNISTENQVLYWTWDRTDAYGRLYQGAAQATIEVRYVYDAVSALQGSFGTYPNNLLLAGNRNVREVWYSREYTVDIGGFDDAGLGLGGWTISAQHVYEPTSGALFKGDGTKQSPDQSPNVVHAYATPVSGQYSYISDLAAGPDGTIYFTYSNGGGGYWLGSVTPGTLALNLLLSSSTSSQTTFTDGTTIGNVYLDNNLPNVASDSNGNLLITNNCRVLRVTLPDTKAYLVAGSRSDNCLSGEYAWGTDGAVAAGATLNRTYSAAGMPDGSTIYLEEDSYSGYYKVRRVALDGTLETVAGGEPDPPGSIPNCSVTTLSWSGSSCSTTCSAFSAPTACLATNVTFPGLLAGLAAGPDGTIYIQDSYDNRVWQIYPHDGQIHPFAGNGTGGHAGDGVVPASQTLPTSTDPTVKITQDRGYALSVVPAGVLVPSGDTNGWFAVREVAPNGLITTLAGTANAVPYIDNQPATRAQLVPVRTVRGPDGYYYTAAVTNYSLAQQIVRFRAGDSGIAGALLTVPSRDGSEVYQFDASNNNRHSATLSASRGETIYTFGYATDGTNHLTSISDPYSNTTNISYTTSAVTITAPHGQTTTINISGNYATSIKNNNSETWIVNWNPTGSGLLSSLEEPLGSGHTRNFQFSGTGQLTVDQNPVGSGGTLLARTYDGNDAGTTTFEVDYSSPAGRYSTHVIDDTADAGDTYTDPSGRTYTRTELRTHTEPAGLVTRDHRYTDGSKVVQYLDSDGGVSQTVTSSYTPDPRLGADDEYESYEKYQNGSKLVVTTTTRTADAGAAWYDLNDQLDTTTVDAGGMTPLTSTFHYSSATNPPTITYTSPATSQTVVTLDNCSSCDADRVTNVAVLGTVPGQTTTLSPVQLGYDTSGRIHQVTQGSRTWQTNYDSSTGWIDSVYTPRYTSGTGGISFNSVSPYRDGVGRPQTVTYPGIGTVNLRYDLNGNLTSLKTPASNMHLFSPNALNLLGSYTPPTSTDGPSGSTTYNYDLDGLVSALNDPTAQVAWTYDGAGRPASVSYPNNGQGTVTCNSSSVTACYTYCALNNNPAGCTAGALQTLNTAGVSLTYTYDGTMMTSEQFKINTPTLTTTTHTVNYTYDGFMRLQQRSIDYSVSTDATYTFSYDGNGLVSEVQQPNVNSPQPYNLNRASNGMLSWSSLGGGVSFSRGSTCDNSSYGGGLIDCYDYDTYGALSTYAVYMGSQRLYELNIIRNSDGRIQSRAETFGSQSKPGCTTQYGYGTSPNSSVVDFLTSSTLTGANCTGLADTYTYDLDGNQTEEAIMGGSSLYDGQDRITSGDSFYSFSYAANGATTSFYDTYSDSWNYTYDSLNNLRAFNLYQSGNFNNGETFTIDGKNRRVYRTVVNPGSVGSGYDSRGWIYSGDRVIGEVDGAGCLLSHFVYVTKPNVPDLVVRKDGICATSTDWNVYRIISDDVGTVKGVVCMGWQCAGPYGNGSYTWGNVAEGIAPTGQTNPPASNPYVYATDFGYPNGNGYPTYPAYQPFGFAGGLLDDLSVTYRFGARDYSWYFNRWLTQDPVRFDGGTNLYAYCNDDPVNCVDPTGLSGDLIECFKITPFLDFRKLLACLAGGGANAGGGPYRGDTDPIATECNKAWSDAYDDAIKRGFSWQGALDLANKAETECLKKYDRSPQQCTSLPPVIPVTPILVVP
jgi:RHS repeat-associated protein